MIECPYCGSTAQLELIDRYFIQEGWTITKTSRYRCGCGETFKTKVIFESDEFEWVTNE